MAAPIGRHSIFGLLMAGVAAAGGACTGVIDTPSGHARLPNGGDSGGAGNSGTTGSGGGGPKGGAGTGGPTGGGGNGGGVTGGAGTGGGGTIGPVGIGGTTGGGMSQWGGGSFPWTVFDGSVPDVPLAVAPGNTWYCDPVKGNDAWDGTSFAMVSGNKGPKKTLAGALTIATLKAGDTILLGGGIYRGRPDLNSITGKVGARITIGSYGRGTGAPILDGGLKPATWTRYSAQGQTTVWQTSTAGTTITANKPVLGIYVHGGTSEFALREVPHGQLAAYGSDTLPPNQTQTAITDKSSKWYFDRTAGVLYADFGGSLGAADPNAADVSILYNSINTGHEPLIVIPQGANYLSFIGLTLRAGSWHGAYSEASNITFDHCDVKFNGGGGVFFDTGETDVTVTGNWVTNTRIWMNVLDNWPRFNNGNATGGWPGSLSWYSQSNALAQGNVIYQNGGEGLILWGTNASNSVAHLSVNNEIRNNIIYDNWSINLYFDNTQNGRAEQNFVFDHPRDVSQTFDNLFTLSNGYNTDWGKRITPANVSLADEPGSSFENPGHAHLSDITLVNNIFAGGKFGFVDYDDGTSVVTHGLKNCVIANNTFIIASQAIPGQQSYGWRHLFAGSTDASVNSIVQNNVIVSSGSSDDFIQLGNATVPGIVSDYNVYSGAGVWSSGGGGQTFAAWKGAHAAWDQHSVNADAMMTDTTEFNQTVAQKPVYDWAKAVPRVGSPAIGIGANLLTRFNTDFTGAVRLNAAFDVGAVAQH